MLTIGESDKRHDVRDGMKERGVDGPENNQPLTGAWCAHYYDHPGIIYSVIKNIIPFKDSCVYFKRFSIQELKTFKPSLMVVLLPYLCSERPR